MPRLDYNGNDVGDVAEGLNLIEPIFVYDRNDGRAVIGGALYRGTGIPALAGQYVFADWLGRLFYGDPSTGEAFEFDLDLTGEALPFRIHSVNQDLSGELYVLGVYQNGSSFDGAIVRVVPEPSTFVLFVWVALALSAGRLRRQRRVIIHD